MDVTDAAIYDEVGKEVRRTQCFIAGTTKPLKDFVSGYWVVLEKGSFLVRLFADSELGKYAEHYELEPTYVIDRFHRAGAQVVANVAERLHLKAEGVLRASREVSYRLIASQ